MFAFRINFYGYFSWVRFGQTLHAEKTLLPNVSEQCLNASRVWWGSGSSIVYLYSCFGPLVTGRYLLDLLK